MWKVRETKLDGDRVVFVPAVGLALPGAPSFDIAAPPGLFAQQMAAQATTIDDLNPLMQSMMKSALSACSTPRWNTI